jgi:sugar lactone lactonase YvrE
MPRAIALAVVLLIASFAPVAASQSGEDAHAEWANQEFCEYFPQTDMYLCFGFKSYWYEYGGLEIFGYPISNEFVEDGLTVQYFERARFEWHPGVWPERHDVLQGLLGVELTADMSDHAAFQPVGAAKDGCIYYAATGHNVCDEFAKRWEMSGGLPVFGYPISEAFEQDGMLVQYFQRARFEHQPGVWPERHDVLLGLLGSEIYEAKVEPEPEPAPEVTVVATDLAQPRGVTYTDHGVYVAEAGVGGDGPCAVLASGAKACFGMTGAITLVDGDGATRVVDGLPSLGEETGEGIGVHDLVVASDGTIYAVIGMGAAPEVRDVFGEGAELLATVVKIDGDGEVTMVADLAAHEEAENPDGTELDTNPYGIAMDGDDLIVADAGGNSLLRVTLDGDVETIAVFEPRLVPAPPFIPADEMPMESVPTNVAVGPDGNYYVAELSGFPFPVGGANVYQVTPDGDVSLYAEGFTNIGDLAFDSDGRLYVLEIVSGGLLNIDEEAAMAGDVSSIASRIVRVEADGSHTQIMHPGMLFATGLAIGDSGELYVVNMAVLPSAQLIRIDLP